MSVKRLGRISEEIKKIVSNAIMSELKDPRISSMTSVTEVEVTKDLRYAKIYVSVLGSQFDKEETLKGLESGKGFIRKEIGNKLSLRYTPEPIFYLDKSIEHGLKISKLLNEIKDSENLRSNGKGSNENE